MSELILTPMIAGHPDLESIRRVNEEAFPPDELMTVEEMLRLTNQADAELLSFRDASSPVGFTLIVKNDACAYIYYLAVDGSLRSKGWGSQALAGIFKRYAPRQIAVDFEIADPRAENYRQRLRRRKFYMKNGFHETGRCTALRGNKFEVFCTGGELREEALLNLIHQMHRHCPDFPDHLYTLKNDSSENLNDRKGDL